jgi:hypothetical protein
MGIFEIGSLNYLPGLASNCDPPDLCLLSSWDYRHEPLAPSSSSLFLNEYINFKYSVFIFDMVNTDIFRILKNF